MKYIFLLLAGLLLHAFPQTVHAQYNDPNGISVPKIIPPSPTSQEFQRFLGYSADGSTGTVNVSIPLYTISLPGINIPLSLKYNTSGIKVSQSIGTLGYGWSLFPGFRITRTIMGKSDNMYRTNNIQTQNQDADYLSQISTLSGGEIPTNGIDGQFDIFTIHLPNYNGSFIVQWNGSAFSAVSVPAAPIKITPVNSSDLSYGFTVTDDKGIVYDFGLVGGAVEYVNGPNTDITSWMLKSISLPGQNNAITFQYQTSVANGPAIAPNQYETIWDNFTTIGVDFRMTSDLYGIPGGADLGAQYGSENVSAGYDSNGTEMTLSTITFPGGSAKFTYSTVVNQGYLQNIKIYNSDQSIIIKNIDVSVNSTSTNLESVNISGQGTYKMQYRPHLPAYNIFDQDRWGYFNNKGNTTMIPAMTLPMMLTNPSTGNTTVYQDKYFPGANKDVDTTAMMGNSLQRITYPTGGWSNFYFEPHAFLHNNVANYGGGLRIRRIDTYDPVSAKIITKTYAYGTGESGMAVLNSYPEDDSFLDVRMLYASSSGHEAEGSVRRVTVNSQSRYRYFSMNTSIWYDVVTEYSDGGKTVYYYKYLPNDVYFISNLGHNLDFLQNLNSLVCPAPDLVKKEVYKNNGSGYTLLSEENYHFNSYDNNGPLSSYVQGLIVNPAANIVADSGQGLTADNKYWSSAYSIYNYWFQYATPTPVPFLVAPYKINTLANVLMDQNKVDYQNNGTITQTTVNDYGDVGAPYNMTRQTVTASNGDSYLTNFYYPTSSSIPNLTSAQQTMVNTLKTNNRLTTLVEKTSFKNSTVPLSSMLYSYADWGNNILNPQTVYTSTAAAAFDPRLQFQGYDNKGNIQSVSKDGGSATCYIYGYGGNYPIAQISNADYNTVVTVLGGASAVQTFRDNVSPTDAAVNAFLAPLRSASSLAAAQVSTYTYVPLVGMKSATDAKGQTTYYEYDSFQRLMNIKDKDQNIVKHIDYHYQNQ
ncbi:hypothetical protein ACFJIV_05640 [Mucilaginibacter sp. UC70_90]